MGSIVKPRGNSLYGSLLRLYPQSFQQHFGPTMLQTFDDMLEAEPSKLGRLQVWARTLADLPVSASREHLTNGRELKMNRNAKIIVGAVVAALIIANAGSFWFGNLHARKDAGVEQVTVAQLADAMQQDNFFSTYGNSAVLFSGKVVDINAHNDAALVTFSTGRPYGVTCQFAKVTSTAVGKGATDSSVRQTAPSLKVGQTISVAAPAGNAERQAHGVLLHNCLAN